MARLRAEGALRSKTSPGPAARNKLKWAFSNPDRLRPGETRQPLTERAAASFATVAQSLRDRGHAPQAVAHFVNRRVFCMFADDVGLLPEHMFTRMLRQARRTPEHFTELAGALFRVMASGGRVGFEAVAWFNGGLFDDGEALPLEKADIDTVLAASDLDWSEVDPSILGTLFERGLDPGKRAQLGAHYTDRDKIMLLVEPGRYDRTSHRGPGAPVPHRSGRTRPAGGRTDARRRRSRDRAGCARRRCFSMSPGAAGNRAISRSPA